MSENYPEDWPRCVSCGDFALDGHLTCGRVGCDEAGARLGMEKGRCVLHGARDCPDCDPERRED